MTVSSRNIPKGKTQNSGGAKNVPEAVWKTKEQLQADKILNKIMSESNKKPANTGA